MDWTVRGSIFDKVRRLFSSRDIQTVSGAHSASYSVAMEAGLRDYNGRCVKLTLHVCLVPRLRISGAIPVPPIGLCRHGLHRDNFTVDILSICA